VLVGIAAASLDVGVEYVKARKQFGVPIGSFQAVQHPLADVATEVDGARLLTYKAAWATDERRERSAAWSAMAYLFAASTAVKAAAASLHFHGGYGYTLEYDIQLYVRRAKALQLIAGDPEAGVDRLADLLYGPASGAVLR
jgi:alkylation response protein AidB-like acyl-CoA dehydrogenase